MGGPLGQEGSRPGFVPVVTLFLLPSGALDGAGGDRTVIKEKVLLFKKIKLH